MAHKNENHKDEKLFKNRLWRLMEREGIHTTRALAEKLASSDITIRYREKSGETSSKEEVLHKKIESINKQVQKHLNAKTCDCLSGEYAIAYCKLFDCSFDYLYGKDTCNTKTNQFIQDETGLSDKAISNLRKHTNPATIALTNALIEEDISEELTHYIYAYFNNCPAIREKMFANSHYIYSSEPSELHSVATKHQLEQKAVEQLKELLVSPNVYNAFCRLIDKSNLPEAIKNLNNQIPYQTYDPLKKEQQSEKKRMEFYLEDADIDHCDYFKMYLGTNSNDYPDEPYTPRKDKTYDYDSSDLWCSE